MLLLSTLLVKGVFSPIPPYRGYFVPSQFALPCCKSCFIEQVCKSIQCISMLCIMPKVSLYKYYKSSFIQSTDAKFSHDGQCTVYVFLICA